MPRISTTNSTFNNRRSFSPSYWAEITEETSEILHLEHSILRCWNLATSESRSEIRGEFWNVLLEKDREIVGKIVCCHKFMKERTILHTTKRRKDTRAYIRNSKMSHPRCVCINNRCMYQSITQQYLKICLIQDDINYTFRPVAAIIGFHPKVWW